MSFTGFFGLSIAFHVATFLILGTFPTDVVRPKDDILEVALVAQPEPEPAPVVAPAPEPEPPTPAPEPEPVKPPPRPIERAPRPSKEPPPPVDKTPPAAAEETLADFSGTTLTGQGGWATAVGNGAAMNAPIGSATGIATGRVRAGVAGGVVGGTGLRIVAAGDLSRQIKPPSADILNAALERNYPKAAKQQGVEGVARIRLRVFASGKLQPLSTLSETYPGFADGCKNSLREIVFQPGLDKDGQPVATDVNYTCRFSVQ